MGTNSSRHDVVVVGARAAGASTAMLLARMGHDVVVLERATFPRDTLSTHGISRSGVVQLARWGLLDDVLASGAPAVRTVTFHAGGESVERRVKDRAGVDHLVAPRRHVLDPLIAGAAADAGAEVRFGVTVTGVRQDGDGRVTGVWARDAAGDPIEIDARVVVGADGLRSRVGRSVGAPLVDVRPATGAAHYAYHAGSRWTGIEFFVGDGTFAGIFPTHGGEACIWVCSTVEAALAARRGTDSLDGALDLLIARSAPGLAARLEGTTRTSTAQGIVGMANQVRRAHGPGWALVGDAAYHRDAITGHGLSDAFRDAELLAVALDGGLRGADLGGALAAYDRERRAAIRDLFDITCSLASYPPQPLFVEHQRRLSAAIDAESSWLASLPVPGERALVA